MKNLKLVKCLCDESIICSACQDRINEAAADMGITLIRAKSTKDQNRIAVHLLNPTAWELEQGLESAGRDQFEAIVIHSTATWPMPESYDERLAKVFQNLSHTETDWCGDKTLHVSFEIPKKLWDEYKKGVGLGMLYGTDLSNFLSRQGVLKQYCVPVVSDKARAKNGLKRISVSYDFGRRY